MSEPEAGAAQPPGAPGRPPPGWLRGADGVEYPPAPWPLRATVVLGVFAPPVSRLPGVVIEAVPRGVSPVVVHGRAVVGVAFVRYHPGGILAYRELLVAVLGRTAFASGCCTIGQIWVDSAASRTGGRELWAIPKQLGAFDWSESEPDGVIRAGLDGVARVVARPGAGLLPRAVSVHLTTAQRRQGRGGDDVGERVDTSSRAVIRPRRVRARWSVEPGGPLAYLRDASPRVGLVIPEASLTFGGQGPGRVSSCP